jgi:hypothetical protein
MVERQPLDDHGDLTENFSNIPYERPSIHADDHYVVPFVFWFIRQSFEATRSDLDAHAILSAARPDGVAGQECSIMNCMLCRGALCIVRGDERQKRKVRLISTGRRSTSLDKLL